MEKFNGSFRISMIKTRWLILLTIAFCVTISGCTSPRSVRSWNNVKKEDTQKSVNKKEDLKEDENNLKEEQAEILLNNMKKEKTETDKSSRKIPSLREQMKKYSEEQEIIKQKVSLLQNDVSNIKNSIDEIKDAVKDFRGQKLQEAIAGEPLGRMAQANIIKSDEAIGKPVLVEKKNITKSIKQVYKEPVTNKKKSTNNDKIKATKIKVSLTVPEKPKEQKTTIHHKKAPKEKEVKELPDTQPANDDFDKALGYFTKKDYHRSVIEFTKITSQEKNPELVSNCNYWLGETHFAMKQYDKAIAYFQKVLKTKKAPKQDNAQAMIGESLVRSGQVAEAKKAFKSLIDAFPQSQYTPHARKMLQQL